MTAMIPKQRADGQETWPLVVAAQGGDREAFGELYRIYQPMIFKFIWWRLGGGSMTRPIAEDLTSDAFVRAFNRISTVEYQGRDIWAWLVTVARNLVADEMKSPRVQRVVNVGDFQLHADLFDHGDASHYAVWVRALRADLDTALRELSPEQATVLRLRYLEEFNIAETAAAMGVTKGAVKALTYRALAALRRHGRLEAHR